ncbi:MAG: DUF4129 domain-containing protein [Frankiaceae bacterium]
MSDDRPPRRPGAWQLVPAGWRLAGVGLLLLVVFAAIGLGTTSHPGGGGQAHQGLFRVEATIVTVAIGWVAVVALALAVWALTMRGGQPKERPARTRVGWVRSLIVLGSLVVIAFLVASVIQRHRGSTASSRRPPSTPQRQHRVTGPGVIDPKVAVVGLLAALALTALAVLAVTWWERRRRDRLGALGSQAADDDAAMLADAIDAAIDDLESERDPRRAVIAAYARMEHALRARGIPRRPWEAPTEYLERVLQELGGQADPVHRLTELFQIAKFSAHEVDEAMRDEAIDALRELRAGLAVPA